MISSPALHCAWLEAAADWENPALHDRVFELAVESRSYAWSAARYREIATRKQGDPIAVAQLARLRRAAEATFAVALASRRHIEPQPYRASTTLLVVMILAMVGTLAYAHTAAPRIGATTNEMSTTR